MSGTLVTDPNTGDYMVVPTQYSFGYQGGTGSGLTFGYQQIQSAPTPANKIKRIGPKLYFNYVKSKLTKTQVKKLKARLTKLQTLVRSADETGQKALYEEFSRMLVVAVRESEAAACGYDVFVNKKDINKFMNLVTESPGSSRNPIRFNKLEGFSRPVPEKIQKVIKSVKAKMLFDELHVLYLDYTGEVVKSTKEKIREKDPVLFGKFSYDDERYYYITDWIDEYCDLTLNVFVDKLKSEDAEYNVSKTDEINAEYLERIKNEIKERDIRLKNTNSSNYRQFMVDEDKVELERLKAENAKLKQDEVHRLEDREVASESKKPWYRRLF